MRAADTIYHIRKLLTQVGPRQTALQLGRHLYHRAFPVKFPVHPFDLRHGVDTSGLIGGRRLSSGRTHDRHITAYWGTAPSAFLEVFALWSQSLSGGPYSSRDYVCKTADRGAASSRVPQQNPASRRRTCRCRCPLLFACHPSPQAEDLLLPLFLPVSSPPAQRKISRWPHLTNPRPTQGAKLRRQYRRRT
jgi:hypothetical protein